MAVQFAAKHSRTSEYRFLPEDITINADLNGRHEKPDIEWLITDILRVGQSTPVVIRNDGGKAVLVAGFSRWRAVSEINKRGLSAMPTQLRCTYVQCTESEAFLINISENRFRNQTTPLDDAHNIKRLLNVYGLTEEQVGAIYFPTAKTEQELKFARKFVRDRVGLISLSPEAADAVRSGRVKESAATAIAKLSQDQQRKVLNSKEGSIERKDVVPAKPRQAKPTPQVDRELMRRVTLALEDVAGVLGDDNENEYIEVDRRHLRDLWDYVQEMKKAKAAA